MKIVPQPCGNVSYRSAAAELSRFPFFIRVELKKMQAKFLLILRAIRDVYPPFSMKNSPPPPIETCL
jgi:hypothetical protein